MTPGGAGALTPQQALGWVGLAVNDERDVRVGRACGVVVDRDTRVLLWLLVEVRARAVRAVPIADVTDDGDGRLTLGVVAGVVERGPEVPRDGAFTGPLERELCRAYRLPVGRGEGRGWDRRRTTSLLQVAPAVAVPAAPAAPSVVDLAPTDEAVRLLGLMDAAEAAEAAPPIGVLLASGDIALWHPLVGALAREPRIQVRGCLADGAAVVARLGAGGVDVVLLDLEELPGLDAVAVVKALRAAGHHDVLATLLTRTPGAAGEVVPGVDVRSLEDPAAVTAHVIARVDARR